MIGKFGAAKDQWFSSFLLQVENPSSWHRLGVDPLSRAMYSSDGPDFEFVQQKRKEGLSIHEAVWQLAWKKSGPEMASLEAWLDFLLQVENHSSWHRLFVDPLSRAMYSSDGPDFEFVQQKRKEGLSIHEAVWQLAWKKSGPEMASLEAWLEEHEKYRSVA